MPTSSCVFLLHIFRPTDLNSDPLLYRLATICRPSSDLWYTQGRRRSKHGPTDLRPPTPRGAAPAPLWPPRPDPNGTPDPGRSGAGCASCGSSPPFHGAAGNTPHRSLTAAPPDPTPGARAPGSVSLAWPRRGGGSCAPRGHCP